VLKIQRDLYLIYKGFVKRVELSKRFLLNTINFVFLTKRLGNENLTFVNRYINDLYIIIETVSIYVTCVP
jgi:hypothetical protein